MSKKTAKQEKSGKCLSESPQYEGVFYSSSLPPDGQWINVRQLEAMESEFTKTKALEYTMDTLSKYPSTLLDYDGDTLLHKAAADSEFKDSVVYILKHAAESKEDLCTLHAVVNAKNKKGETPLHCVTDGYNIRSLYIPLLILNGANPDTRNSQGQTLEDIIRHGESEQKDKEKAVKLLRQSIVGYQQKILTEAVKYLSILPSVLQQVTYSYLFEVLSGLQVTIQQPNFLTRSPSILFSIIPTNSKEEAEPQDSLQTHSMGF